MPKAEATGLRCTRSCPCVNCRLTMVGAPGKQACVGYEVPPSAAATLDAMGLDSGARHPLPHLSFCSLNDAAALAQQDVKVVRISEDGGHSLLPLAPGHVSRAADVDGVAARSVTVGWDGGDVKLVPYLEIRGALCEVEVSSRHSPTVYVNGSLQLGASAAPVPALVSVALHPDADLSRARQGWVQAALPDGVPVGQVLEAFGCSQQALSGLPQERCEISLQAAINSTATAARSEEQRRLRLLQDRLVALGVPKMSLTVASIESTFELASDQYPSRGRVFWKASGVPSTMERGVVATVLASFSPRARLSDTYDMHTVLAMTFARVWTDVTVRKLVRAFGGLEMTSLVDALQLSDLCVLVANRDTSQDTMPQLRHLASFAPRGVSIKAILPLDNRNAGLGSLAQRLQRILGGKTLVELLAPLGYKSLTFSAHTPDLWLGGGGYAGASKGLLRTSGAEMISPVMRLVVDAQKLDMSFTGQVLLPITESETMKMSGSLKIDAAAQTLVLEAGTSKILYDAFGMPNMHLSYGVIQQAVAGLRDTRYIMQAEVSVCSLRMSFCACWPSFRRPAHSIC